MPSLSGFLEILVGNTHPNMTLSPVPTTDLCFKFGVSAVDCEARNFMSIFHFSTAEDYEPDLDQRRSWNDGKRVFCFYTLDQGYGGGEALGD